jgi:Protein of unknown function (DUF1549)/Protein of unknown function (DUF1553)
MITAHGRKAVLVLMLVTAATTIVGQEPSQATPVATSPSLSERIDALIPNHVALLAADSADDGQLLRRLSLDLRGVVPTRAELDAFVADTSPERWKNWVKAFLDDPLCDEHLVTFLDRTLMLRRPHVQVDRAGWLNYLREQVANHTPIDQLSRQLLNSPWWNRDQRVSQRFYLDRGGDPHMIARDLGRVFLGRDFQCAQCHDHPLVDSYKQIDYHGLLAYVSPSALVETAFKDAEGKDQKVQLYVEKAAGDAAFESVFDKGVPFRSGPRLPQQPEQFESYTMPDARYAATAPADAMAGVALPPQQSRRQLLAEQLSSRTNRAFVANWANRFWAFIFGQGIVQPLDMHHDANPPSNPALYAILSDGLLQCDMQPRKFLEQLALTQVYRRGTVTRLQSQAKDNSIAHESVLPEQRASIRNVANQKLAELNTQKEALAKQATEAEANFEAARTAWRTIQADRAKLRAELDGVEAAMLDAKKKSTDATNALAAAQKKFADNNARVALLDDAATKIQQSIDLTGADDVELKQSIAITKQRADAARGQVPALDKAVVDAKSASDATVPLLAAATAKVQDVVARLQPVQQSLSAADAAMVAAREILTGATSAVASSDQEVKHWDQIASWLDGIDRIERIGNEVTLTMQVAANIQTQVVTATEAVNIAQSALAAAQLAEQAASKNLAAANEAKLRHAAELVQLQQTLDGLAASIKLVSTNEALAAAQTPIQAEIETRKGQVGQLQTAIDVANQALVAATTLIASKTQDVSDKQAELKSATDRLTAANTQVDLKTLELQSSRETGKELWSSVVNDSAGQLAIATMTPLTPEQLCWSTLRIGGQLDAYIQVEVNELEKASPLPADADATAKAARKRQAVRAAFDKLRGNADVYVSLYASGPDKTQDDFFASADQALYTANAGNVFAWAGPGNNNPTQQAIASTDNQQIAQTLYWSLLCRQPTAQEVQMVSEQISAAGDQRNAVIQEMAWSLMASVEFRFCK